MVVYNSQSVGDGLFINKVRSVGTANLDKASNEDIAAWSMYLLVCLVSSLPTDCTNSVRGAIIKGSPVVHQTPGQPLCMRCSILLRTGPTQVKKSVSQIVASLASLTAFYSRRICKPR